MKGKNKNRIKENNIDMTQRKMNAMPEDAENNFDEDAADMDDTDKDDVKPDDTDVDAAHIDDADIDGGDDEVYVELMEKVIQDFISDRYGTYADVNIELSDEMEIAGIRVILSGDNPMEGENAQTGKQIDHGEADSGEMSKVLSDEYGLDQEKISIAGRAGK